MDPPDPLPFVTSTSLLNDLPSAGVDALIAAAGPGSGSPLAMVELRHMGGALARRSPEAGARATLPGSIAMLSLGVAEDDASATTARSYLDAVDRAVLPYRSGDYPNFVMRAGRRQQLLRRRHLGPPAPGEGALRPERPVHGQPPHPTRVAELNRRLRIQRVLAGKTADAPRRPHARREIVLGVVDHRLRRSQRHRWRVVERTLVLRVIPAAVSGLFQDPNARHSVSTLGRMPAALHWAAGGSALAQAARGSCPRVAGHATGYRAARRS